MPKPKPMTDEMHQEWMERCMGNAVMMDDHADMAERRQSCEIIWRDREKSARNPSASYPTPGGLGKKALDAPMECKVIGDTGSFSGYAAVFGNLDMGGDIVERGAFKEFVTTRDNQMRVLYMHDSRNPIGKAMVKEDSKGLAFDGTLVLEDALARKAYAYMKAGILDGMSIGFDVLEGGGAVDASGIRRLTKLKLWEISPVVFGMNPLAQIEAVKAALQITNIREFEDFLREAGGFSRAQAKMLASGGWSRLDGQREVDSEAETMKYSIDFLNSISKEFTP